MPLCVSLSHETPINDLCCHNVNKSGRVQEVWILFQATVKYQNSNQKTKYDCWHQVSVISASKFSSYYWSLNIHVD